MDYIVRVLLSVALISVAYRWVTYIKNNYSYMSVSEIVRTLPKVSDSRLVGVCFVASLFACIGISGFMFVLYQMVYM